MTNMLNNGKVIIGYTTDEHVLLDIDNVSSIGQIETVALALGKLHDLGDCLILLSSRALVSLSLRVMWSGLFQALE